MKNSLGTSIILTVFGESHGEMVGVVVDGLTPGLEVDDKFIQENLTKRRPQKELDTPRIEEDNYKIISGVYNGYTTGSPLCLLVNNQNTKSSDYEEWRGKARPGQVDYAAYMKYHGFEDYHGSGHFSGRVTAGIVAAGSILMKALEKKGIYIGSHIYQLGNIKDHKYQGKLEEILELKKKTLPTLDKLDDKIKEEILNAKNNNDSIGGIIETMVYGLPSGVGEPWFDSMESKISQALFGIGGIKGIEFGLGFETADKKGSMVNDQYQMIDGEIKTLTNNSGGINGGITNGMPVIFRTCVKPTSSISKKQDTVDFIKKENTTIELTGRHDPAIVRRIGIVIDSLVSFVIADLLCMRYGTDYLK